MSATVHLLRIYLYNSTNTTNKDNATNTTNKDNAYMLCSLQHVSADFYGHIQVVAEFR